MYKTLEQCLFRSGSPWTPGPCAWNLGRSLSGNGRDSSESLMRPGSGPSVSNDVKGTKYRAVSNCSGPWNGAAFCFAERGIVQNVIALRNDPIQALKEPCSSGQWLVSFESIAEERTSREDPVRGNPDLRSSADPPLAGRRRGVCHFAASIHGRCGQAGGDGVQSRHVPHPNDRKRLRRE